MLCVFFKANTKWVFYILNFFIYFLNASLCPNTASLFLFEASPFGSTYYICVFWVSLKPTTDLIYQPCSYLYFYMFILILWWALPSLVCYGGPNDNVVGFLIWITQLWIIYVWNNPVANRIFKKFNYMIPLRQSNSHWISDNLQLPDSIRPVIKNFSIYQNNNNNNNLIWWYLWI